MKSTILLTFLILCSLGASLLYSQTEFPLERKPLAIAVISDGSIDEDPWFEEEIKQEVSALLDLQFKVTFKQYFSDYSGEKAEDYIEQSFDDNEVDIVVTIGIISSSVLASKTPFSKPSIAAIVVDREVQGLPLAVTGGSGVENFAYIQTPFSMERDLRTLHRIFPYKKIGIISEGTGLEGLSNITSLFDNVTSQLGTTYLAIPVFTSNPQAIIDAIPEDVDALYVLPLFDLLDTAQLEEFFVAIADRGLPSFALLGEQVYAGAMGGYEAESNVNKIERRVALDISKIAEGKAASDLPVIIESLNTRLLINMKIARKIGIYPDWDMLAEATLVDVNGVETDRILDLRTAIAEALENNLELKADTYAPQIAEEDVDIARSSLWPQLTASSLAVLIDQNRADASFGQQAPLTWSVTGELSQVILSEPASANVKIQKLLQQGEEYGLKASQLDMVLTAAQGYLNLLQAKSLLKIQNENVNVTRKNLDIATDKEGVGYSAITDVYRWESELALNNIDLNEAQASVRQAEYSLNQILNRRLTDPFETKEVSLTDGIIFILDERIEEVIDSPGDVEKFANFLVTKVKSDLPELKQLESNIAAQERSLTSQERAYWLPSLALTGQADYVLGKYLQDAGVPQVDVKPTWNLGLGLQYPLFQGGERSAQKEKTELSILQLQHQYANALSQFELQLRSNMETVGVSYSSVGLSRKAADAALANFEIVQDLYRQGLANVTQLIDAQRSALQTEVSATNALYQFILDFLNVERSIGSFYFLSTPQQQQRFFDELQRFINNQ